MYRQIIIPTPDNHTIELPNALFGKKVEVTMVEVGQPKAILSKGKPVSLEKIFETFGADPEFPTLDELRKKAWPDRW